MLLTEAVIMKDFIDAVEWVSKFVLNSTMEVGSQEIGLHSKKGDG